MDFSRITDAGLHMLVQPMRQLAISRELMAQLSSAHKNELA